MSQDKYINLEELSMTTQALLAKINEQSNLKVNKANVNAEYNTGTKLGSIDGIDLYLPKDDNDFLIVTLTDSSGDEYYGDDFRTSRWCSTNYNFNEVITAMQNGNKVYFLLSFDGKQIICRAEYDNSNNSLFGYGFYSGYYNSGYAHIDSVDYQPDLIYDVIWYNLDGVAPLINTYKCPTSLADFGVQGEIMEKGNIPYGYIYYGFQIYGVTYTVSDQTISTTKHFFFIPTQDSNNNSTTTLYYNNISYNISCPPYTAGKYYYASITNNVLTLSEIATLADIPNVPDTSNFMIKGTDYVTAGQKSGTTLGIKATAEGLNTTASGYYSHAEGVNTIASGHYSHAEGYATTASNQASHAEGYNTAASGSHSHAEGSSTAATGDYSHAEGWNTTASGSYSHVEGSSTTASGTYSHAEGYATAAQRKSQHVFGEYNILDTTGTTTTRGQYIEIVGKGTSSSYRSNARTLDWSGNEVLAGKLTIGAAPTENMDVTTKQYVDNKITTDIATAIGNINNFEVAIVTDLPTTNIDTHTIYFKSNSSSGNNVYDEYMYINNNWELIGSTAIDLTPYALSANLATVATTGDYTDLSNTPVLATVATTGDYDDLLDAPAAETDVNVESMLDSFNLDYTSNTSSPNYNYATGVSF